MAFSQGNDLRKTKAMSGPETEINPIPLREERENRRNVKQPLKVGAFKTVSTYVLHASNYQCTSHPQIALLSWALIFKREMLQKFSADPSSSIPSGHLPGGVLRYAQNCWPDSAFIIVTQINLFMKLPCTRYSAVVSKMLASTA